MNFFRQVAGLLAIGFLIGCGKADTPGGNPVAAAPEIDPTHGHLLHAQPKLPTLKVWVGDQELITEVAREPIQIATGMMFRTNMAENEAMIFVFPTAERREFYMRNCIVPLSGAYISPDGTILEIIQMQPHDETPIPSQSANVQFVLEVPRNWFARHNIGTGAVVKTDLGTLKETFFRRQ